MSAAQGKGRAGLADAPARAPWFAGLERRFQQAMTVAQNQRERMPEQAEFWRGREGAFYDALAWLDDVATESAWTIRQTRDNGYTLIQPDGLTSGIVYLGLDAFTKAETEAAKRNAARAEYSQAKATE